MRKYLSYLLLLMCVTVLSSALTSCGGDEPKPAPEPVADPVSRTVLVYMVADNSLGTRRYDIADLEEMISAAGKLNGGRVLVYWNCVMTEDYPPRLIEILPEGGKELKKYADDPTITSVDPERFREVMADMKSYAPADDYGLVLWSHSNGWVGPYYPGNDKYRAWGDDRGYHITLPSLAEALKGEKFSFIYFDSCNMGNIESIYEMRALTDRIVASPTELGQDGMPYDLNLPCFFEKVPDLEQAALNTFRSYADDDAACQMAVYDLTKLPAFVEATRAIFDGLSAHPADYSGLQRFNRAGETCYTFDMESYMELIATPAQLEAWRTALGALVTYHDSTPYAIGGLRIDRCCGLGSYVVRSESDIDWRGYSSMAWWNDVVSRAPLFAR